MSEPEAVSTERNVLGEPLLACSFSPLTGYFRDGSCAMNGVSDVAHVVLESTHERVLKYAPLSALRRHAADGP